LGTYTSKTRYRQADSATVLKQAELNHFEMTFPEPQWAVTPGQSAVLYDGDVCLGGGIITTAQTQIPYVLPQEIIAAKRKRYSAHAHHQ
jgi:hypothetical protein